MKIAVIIVRVLMGLLFIFGSVAFFLKLGGEPQLEGNMKTYFDGLVASGLFSAVVENYRTRVRNRAGCGTICAFSTCYSRADNHQYFICPYFS